MQNENLRGARTAHRRAHAIVQHLALGEDEEALLDAHDAAAKLKRSPNGTAAKKAGGAKKVPFRERKLEQHDVDGLSRLLVRTSLPSPRGLFSWRSCSTLMTYALLLSTPIIPSCEPRSWSSSRSPCSSLATIWYATSIAAFGAVYM